MGLQPPEDNCYACKAAVGIAFGLVLRLGLVSGLYKWLFYLATVKQHKHVDNNTLVGLNLGVIHCERRMR